MAGFVALFKANSSPLDREKDFQNLLELTAQYKGLEIPNEYAIGRDCIAAKLDAPSSLHRGIVHHEESGFGCLQLAPWWRWKAITIRTLY